MPTKVQQTLTNARNILLSERNESGHWEGELSTSALSTATAIVALGCVDPKKNSDFIAVGLHWLEENQNPDGGWGDTIKSYSNISTTLLCWSALSRFRSRSRSIRPASNWIRDYVGSLEPDLIAETVKARYGKDRTFSAPILMLCAICGTLGKDGWRKVMPMPFELAAFPREWFAAMKLPVVSYALPALIAIGYARFQIAPPLPLLPIYWIRKMLWKKVSSLLKEIQPSSGGFLEAAPLTSFVSMALASAGEKNHPVVKKGVEFLTSNVRPDGSWPIDTNLATWATTLSVKALSTKESMVSHLTLLDRGKIRDWLLAQQYSDVHPFTNSPPGGWAWTDLPGGVPDADDTPGAMLALHSLLEDDDDAVFEASRKAAEAGAEWLLKVQNRDGGIPTFCRGWGALPFDRSSPDLTAHALRAWMIWFRYFSIDLQQRIETATELALGFLEKQQQSDGSWLPLWFGNQDRFRDESNPTYGTSMVLLALQVIPNTDELRSPGTVWLKENQNPDGGWGSGEGTASTIEETALVLSALSGESDDSDCLYRGEEWLADATELGTKFPASPIGFYFARLWYFEKIYPITWTVEALSKTMNREESAEAESSRRLAF